MSRPDSSTLLRLLGGFALPGQREAATRQLAAVYGCDAAWLFAPDPELGVPLPAPGLPQTLRHARQWRAFIAACNAPGGCVGTLPADDGAQTPARGVAEAGGCCLIVIGAGAHTADLEPAMHVLPTLGALFYNERIAAAAAARVTAAGDAASRAETLTASLQRMRLNLESALIDAEQARNEARAHADESEALTEELLTQTSQLESQAAELESLNVELEEQTAEAVAARIAAERANSAKSDFLATVSHELRTPINAILGYSEILELEIAGAVNAQQRAHLERIRASSRHLLTLINDVLDLAKIEAGHMTVAQVRGNLRAPIVDALALLTLQADERGLTIRDDCGDDAPDYVGDENRVRQVLVNLLSNAIKFTESGGTISLRCGNAAHHPAAAGDAGSGRWIFLEVEDTGIGMSEAELRAVFKPFVQAQTGRTRASGGSGLGLTISRQLARLMGGDLTARSAPGRGSCFTLWLPPVHGPPLPLDDSILVDPA